MMNPFSKLKFSGNNSFLEVTVMSYAYPNATDFYDLNWLRCKASCQISSLETAVDLFLQTTDFVTLQKSLLAFNAQTSDIIVFSTIEEQLQFCIERHPKDIMITGKISALPSICSTFTFEITAETLMTSTMESLKNIRLNFPVVNER